MIVWIFRTARSIASLGLMGALRLFLASQRSGNFLIRPKGYRHAIGLRGCTSDPVIFYNIFCVGGYPVVNLNKIEAIVDAGANAGYFSVFAAHHYPQASIIAIEPEDSNFALLSSNVKPYAGVVCIKAGVWSEEGVLRIDDPGAEKWSFKCKSLGSDEQQPGKAISAVTIGGLLRDHHWPSIDILKMDIEGGEKEVFSARDTSWLSKVRVLICELHPGCWRSFFEALKAHEYDCRQVGENIVVLLHDLASASGILKRP